MRAPLREMRVLIASLALSGAAGAAQDVKETAQVCAGCHGENGTPIDKVTPIIWGQNEGYLYLQLRDFKSGARKNDTMGAIVASLEKDDIKALAAHFSGLKWPDLQQPSAPSDVASKAQTSIASIGCTGCHLQQFQGDGSTPRIAGQQHDYLKATMLAFRDRSRGNNPGMSDLMNAASSEDLTAIATYLAGLQIIGGTNGR
jgi:cytochrome c553